MEDFCLYIYNLIILLQVTRETLKAFLLVNEYNLKQNSASGAQYLSGNIAGSSSFAVCFPAVYLACNLYVVAQFPPLFS